jgi:hypothetical protein
MPPLVIPADPNGNARHFTDLLFPLQRGIGTSKETTAPTIDFWDWQRGIARRIEYWQEPARPVARAKWLTKCVADVEWDHAVAEIGDIYYKFVRFLHARDSRWRNVPEARVRARMGEPDCEHVLSIMECHDCHAFDFGAREAHLGWAVQRDWSGSSAAFSINPTVQAEIADCDCCARAHDRRSISTLVSRTRSPACASSRPSSRSDALARDG